MTNFCQYYKKNNQCIEYGLYMKRVRYRKLIRYKIVGTNYSVFP